MEALQVNLPRDANAWPVQTLSPVDTAVAGFTLSTTSQPTAMPSGAQIVEVAVTGNCVIMFGTSSGINVTTGTHRILTPGVYTYNLVQGNTTFTYFDAATTGGSSGSITVTKMV